MKITQQVQDKLDDAQKDYAFFESLPENNTFTIGTVIKFRKEDGASQRFAVKTLTDRWHLLVEGHNNSSYVTYEQLMTYIGADYHHIHVAEPTWRDLIPKKNVEESQNKMCAAEYLLVGQTISFPCSLEQHISPYHQHNGDDFTLTWEA